MNPEQINQFLRERRKPEGELINQEAIALFVDELLECEETNLVWVPDSLESKVYKHVLTTVITIMEDVLNSSEISILGLTFRFSLVSALGSRRKKEMRRSMSVMRFHHQSGELPLAQTRPELEAASGLAQPEENKDGGSSATTSTFLSEDDEPLVFGKESVMRSRLDSLYQQAEVLERLLREKPGDTVVLPYKGLLSATEQASAGEQRLKVNLMQRSASAVYVPGAQDTLVSSPRGQPGAGSGDTTENAAGAAAAPTAGEAEREGGATTMTLRQLARQRSMQSLADTTKREFQKMVAQDSLARFLQVRRKLASVPVEIPFEMIKNVEEYSTWMPMCTEGEVLETASSVVEKISSQGEEAAASPSSDVALESVELPSKVKVAFGIQTNTFLGVLGDNVTYEMSIQPPREVTRHLRGGFAYGDRLIYDWVFVRNSQDDTTEVSLNLFLKVNSVLYLPIWDAMQQVLTEKMLQAFEARAKEIKGAK
eukprot:g13295.t1